MKDQTKDLARVLKVLSVDTRVRIVQLLKGRTLCVNGIARRLGVTSGAVSQHLRVMRDTRLVFDEKNGNEVHYRLNEEALAAWRTQADTLLDPSAEPCDCGPGEECECHEEKAAGHRCCGSHE